jgi:hypothetical protein
MVTCRDCQAEVWQICLCGRCLMCCPGHTLAEVARAAKAAVGPDPDVYPGDGHGNEPRPCPHCGDIGCYC